MWMFIAIVSINIIAIKFDDITVTFQFIRPKNPIIIITAKKQLEIGRIHLGGIPMIADDMMTFIKKDIIVFGIGVFAFIIVNLKRKKILESSAFDNEKDFEKYKDKLKSENNENIK